MNGIVGNNCPESNTGAAGRRTAETVMEAPCKRKKEWMWYLVKRQD